MHHPSSHEMTVNCTMKKNKQEKQMDDTMANMNQVNGQR